MNINVVMLVLAEYVIKYHMESDRADTAEVEIEELKLKLTTAETELESVKAQLKERAVTNDG